MRTVREEGAKREREKRVGGGAKTNEGNSTVTRDETNSIACNRERRRFGRIDGGWKGERQTMHSVRNSLFTRYTGTDDVPSSIHLEA